MIWIKIVKIIAKSRKGIGMHSFEILENIKKLLENENISNYQISKETGIPQSTLSAYTTKRTDIESMNLSHALKLLDYYMELKTKGEID